MRLILCDDHLMLAEALGVVLAARGHDVLAVTSTPDSAVAAVRAQEPDICLLDLSFHGERSGLDAARAIFAMRNHTKVVVLSGVCDPDTLSEAVELPVAGFLRKDQNVDEIAGALEVIAAGGILIAPTVRRTWAGRESRPRPRGPMDDLTAREHEIVSRIVNGESTKHMAAAMHVTPDTVRSYVKNVLAKLGLHNRLQIAAMASRDGNPVADEPAGPPPSQG
jgi:two-component system, NarL family, nitrate/nitrite response regulator NarL